MNTKKTWDPTNPQDLAMTGRHSSSKGGEVKKAEYPGHPNYTQTKTIIYYDFEPGFKGYFVYKYKDEPDLITYCKTFVQEYRAKIARQRLRLRKELKEIPTDDEGLSYEIGLKKAAIEALPEVKVFAMQHIVLNGYTNEIDWSNGVGFNGKSDNKTHIRVFEDDAELEATNKKIPPTETREATIYCKWVKL